MADYENFFWIATITGVLFVCVIFYTRLAGLRSFSKISSFDFAMTIAIGSTIASTVLSESVSLWEGAWALAMLFLIQSLIAFFKKKSSKFSRLVDNSPTLLMRDGKLLSENLSKVRMTEADLRAKLRQSNVQSYAQVRAAVFETTGDISVITGKELNEKEMLQGVAYDPER